MRSKSDINLIKDHPAGSKQEKNIINCQIRNQQCIKQYMYIIISDSVLVFMMQQQFDSRSVVTSLFSKLLCAFAEPHYHLAAYTS